MSSNSQQTEEDGDDEPEYDIRNVRIKKRDHRVLKWMKDAPEVKEIAVDQGVIDDESESLTFEDMFTLIIPGDADPIERPEDEMSWQNAGEAKQDILDLAGENVSVHEVVTVFRRQFANQHDLKTDHV